MALNGYAGVYVDTTVERKLQQGRHRVQWPCCAEPPGNLVTAALLAEASE